SFPRDPGDFSLVLGGPIFQLLRRSHLTNDALELAHHRIIVISLFSWLPLVVLSALEGKMLGGIAVPFMLDAEVHVRFLVVIPLLISAELVVHRRMRFVVKQFLERHLIPESAMARFNAAIASVFRLRNSVLAEVLLFTFVYLSYVRGARPALGVCTSACSGEADRLSRVWRAGRALRARVRWQV